MRHHDQKIDAMPSCDSLTFSAAKGRLRLTWSCRQFSSRHTPRRHCKECAMSLGLRSRPTRMQKSNAPEGSGSPSSASNHPKHVPSPYGPSWQGSPTGLRLGAADRMRLDDDEFDAAILAVTRCIHEPRLAGDGLPEIMGQRLGRTGAPHGIAEIAAVPNGSAPLASIPKRISIQVQAIECRSPAEFLSVIGCPQEMTGSSQRNRSSLLRST